MSNYFGLACVTGGIGFCACEWKCVKRPGGSASSPFSVQLSSSSARTFPRERFRRLRRLTLVLYCCSLNRNGWKHTFVSSKSWIDFIFPCSHTFSHFIELFWFLIFWLGCAWAGPARWLLGQFAFISINHPFKSHCASRPRSTSLFSFRDIKHRVLLSINYCHIICIRKT